MRLKGPQTGVLLRRRGQATIEYVLMLATIVVLVAAFLTAFSTHLVKWFFQFIGILLMS